MGAARAGTACGPAHGAPALTARPGFPLLGLGVDRLDYTKGIVSRLEAIERLLEKYPAYQGRLGFIQIAVPSRTQIEDYRRVKEHVEEVVARINSRFSRGAAHPIHYRYAQVEPAELAVYYRMADFAMVTSLHDGMNLWRKSLSPPRLSGGRVTLQRVRRRGRRTEQCLAHQPLRYRRRGRDAAPGPGDVARGKGAPHGSPEYLAEHNIYKWLVDVFTTLASIRKAMRARPERLGVSGDSIPALSSDWQ